MTVDWCDLCSGYHKLGHHYPLWDVWLDDGDSTQRNGHMTVIAEDAKHAAVQWAYEAYGSDENEFTERGGVAVLVSLHEHRHNDDVPTFRYWVRGMIRVQYYAQENTDE